MSDKIETKAGIRRLGREIALRALFLYDSGEKLTGEEAFHLFCGNFGPDVDEEDVLECGKGRFEKALPFVRELFFGVVNNQKEIDGILTGASNNWRLDRMSRVDRNVMRLALFEMKFRDDIPPKVSINEAIDLGKSFGAEDSGSFINGILDRIHHQMFPENKVEEET